MNRTILGALASLSLIACGSDVTAVTRLTGDAGNGETVFKANCLGCHGADGKSGSAHRDIAAAAKDKTDEAVSVILDGKDEMQGFAGVLTSQQIADVVAYLKTK